ncbi:MAG TPA: ring-cleaving dioxygenase [Gemmatimonadota bacterium]|nr:ring-cleaving dioxygenase [Gemmatimonadota bacterium]
MSDEASVHGIHHVTAIAGAPQENLEFYVGVLGMRLVKRSVNQDDPGTYHLFYADSAGTPGTDVTFFPWTRMAPSRRGAGMVGEIALAVPAGSLDWWRGRLGERDVPVAEEELRFGERTLPFHDPHGLALALVEIAEDREFAVWEGSPVPPEHQIRGVHAVRIQERVLAPTVQLLEGVMGFHRADADGSWQRWSAGHGSGAFADLQEAPEAPFGRWGTGAVHHVAWRVKDDAEQIAVRAAVESSGLQPTPVIDRFWFRSVYFKEPGGTLFELATDGPGFDRDEDPERLGEALILPPWLERHRSAIESALPPLEMPAAAT